MIDTIIFDIGQVLVSWHWSERVEAAYGSEVAAKVNSAVWGDGNWNEMDRGTRDVAGVREHAIAAAPDCAAQITEALEHIGEYVVQFPYAKSWIDSLRAAGYRVLFLSNYSHDLIERNPAALDFLPHLEGGVFSCDVHLTKPEREIYQTLCEKYDLTPGNCLFIDDNAANIAAAREFGLNAIRFVDYERSYPEVAAFLKANGKF